MVDLTKLATLFVAWRPWILAAVALLFGALVIHALATLTRDIHYPTVLRIIQDTPAKAIALGLVATAISYLALVGYDYGSLKLVGAKVPFGVIVHTSFIAYAVGNTVGTGVLTGGAVRMRLYTAAGADAGQVTRSIIVNALSFGLGIGVLGAAGILWQAEAVAAVVFLPTWLLKCAAAIYLGLLSLWVLTGNCGWKLRFLSRTLTFYPGNRFILGQLCVSVMDIVASAAVLWLLLPNESLVLGPFILFFAIAVTLGIISHVPGGLGVFEAIMLLALNGQVATEALAGALLLFRVLYYLVPLAIALVLLTIRETLLGKKNKPGH